MLCIGVRSAISERQTQQSCNGPAPMTTLFSLTISDFRRFWLRAGKTVRASYRFVAKMHARSNRRVARVLRQHADQLLAGAIITIDEMTSRLRILPIQRKSNPAR